MHPLRDWRLSPGRDVGRGQILIVTAASLIVLLAIAALVIDLGFSWMLHRQEQNAADPGAIAAARWLKDPATGQPAWDQTKANQDACFYAQQNGFFSGDNNCAAAILSHDLQVASPQLLVDIDREIQGAQCCGHRIGIFTQQNRIDERSSISHGGQQHSPVGNAFRSGDSDAGVQCPAGRRNFRCRRLKDVNALITFPIPWYESRLMTECYSEDRKEHLIRNTGQVISAAKKKN